jgi:hypothetical protein
MNIHTEHRYAVIRADIRFRHNTHVNLDIDISVISSKLRAVFIPPPHPRFVCYTRYYMHSARHVIKRYHIGIPAR